METQLILPTSFSTQYNLPIGSDLLLWSIQRRLSNNEPITSELLQSLFQLYGLTENLTTNIAVDTLTTVFEQLDEKYTLKELEINKVLVVDGRQTYEVYFIVLGRDFCLKITYLGGNYHFQWDSQEHTIENANTKKLYDFINSIIHYKISNKMPTFPH